MEDSLAIVFAVIVSILLMFLFPLMDVWELQDNLSYATTYATVVDFVDTVRNTGKITPDVYNAFITKLGMTGNSFNVTMEHRKFIPDLNGYLNVYTNEILNGYNVTYEENGEEKVKRINGINDNLEYKFNKYDYFYVTVRNTNKTQATIIREFINANNEESFKIGTAYGGIVWSTAE